MSELKPEYVYCKHSNKDVDAVIFLIPSTSEDNPFVFKGHSKAEILDLLVRNKIVFASEDTSSYFFPMSFSVEEGKDLVNAITKGSVDISSNEEIHINCVNDGGTFTVIINEIDGNATSAIEESEESESNLTPNPSVPIGDSKKTRSIQVRLAAEEDDNDGEGNGEE